MNELRQLTSMHSNTLGFTNNKETLEDISAHVKSAQKLTRLAKCVDVELQILRKTRKENKSVTVSCDKLSGFFRSITELKNSIKNSWIFPMLDNLLVELVGLCLLNINLY